MPKTKIEPQTHTAGDAVKFAAMRTPTLFRPGRFVELKPTSRGDFSVVTDDETGQPFSTRPSLVVAA